MKLLALDLGTTAGFCIGSQSWTAEFATKAKEEPGLRWIRFREKVSDVVFTHAITTIAYEKVSFHSGVRDAHAYGAFEAILQELSVLHGFTLMPVQVTTLKKVATGNSRAKKEQMVEAANRLHKSTHIEDHNEADAVCLYYVAKSILRESA